LEDELSKLFLNLNTIIKIIAVTIIIIKKIIKEVIIFPFNELKNPFLLSQLLSFTLWFNALFEFEFRSSKLLF